MIIFVDVFKGTCCDNERLIESKVFNDEKSANDYTKEMKENHKNIWFETTKIG